MREISWAEKEDLRAGRAHLVEKVLNELDLVRNLGSTEDGEEGLLGRLEDLGKVLELLGHEETSSLLGKVDTDHGRVGAVSGSKGVVDVDISELGEGSTELLDGLGVGLGLLALGILRGSLLLGVEAEVLQEDNLAVLGLGDVLLGLLSDAVLEEGDGLGDERLELLGDGSERVLVDDVTVGAAEVRHEDHGRSSIVESVLDGRDGSGDTLLV